jgi:uncharacterized coiled-coil protein SlyX
MNDKFTKAIAELEQALAEHASAKECEQSANSRMCAARNRVNKAQKELDMLVATMKNHAPWNTDWHQHKQEKQS